MDERFSTRERWSQVILGKEDGSSTQIMRSHYMIDTEPHKHFPVKKNMTVSIALLLLESCQRFGGDIVKRGRTFPT
jgi:hypothetical protein